MKLSQQVLADKIGMNRTVLGRLEACNYYPSIQQLESLGEILGFEPTDLYVDDQDNSLKPVSPMNIAVAGTG